MSKKQIHKLYLLTAVGYFLPAGSSWVALLALRGFSVLEIGLLESIFHIVSFCFEFHRAWWPMCLGGKGPLCSVR